MSRMVEIKRDLIYRCSSLKIHKCICYLVISDIQDTSDHLSDLAQISISLIEGIISVPCDTNLHLCMSTYLQQPTRIHLLGDTWCQLTTDRYLAEEGSQPYDLLGERSCCSLRLNSWWEVDHCLTVKFDCLQKDLNVPKSNWTTSSFQPTPSPYYCLKPIAHQNFSAFRR